MLKINLRISFIILMCFLVDRSVVPDNGLAAILVASREVVRIKIRNIKHFSVLMNS